MSLLGVNDNVKTILVSRSSVKPDFFYIYTKFQHIFGKLSEHTHTHTEAQTQTGRQTDRLSLSLGDDAGKRTRTGTTECLLCLWDQQMCVAWLQLPAQGRLWV